MDIESKKVLDYQKTVAQYFDEKRARFLKKYPDFERLNKAHSESLRQWKNDKSDYKIYHNHANLSTTYKTIKKKLKGDI